MAMKITILGTGTSQGVPVIGCQCPVCLSDDPRDSRLRVSVHIEIEGVHLQIDCGPDFRQQMLRNDISEVDALLITHEHNDHVIGLDDLRPIMFKQRKPVSVHASPRVVEEIRNRFQYAFTPQPYPGAPKFDMFELDGNINIQGVDIAPIDILHGPLPILGYRIENFAYLTDVKTIPTESLEKLRGLDVLVLDALHHRDHHAHLTLREAIDYAHRINAKKTYFTHMSHAMGLHHDVNSMLPANMELCFDGQIMIL